VSRYQRNDRVRTLLAANAMMYVILLMAVMSSAFTGLVIETDLAVDLLFRVFPIGFFSAMAAAGLFNVYAWVTE
jgi:hypothetical protein